MRLGALLKLYNIIHWTPPPSWLRIKMLNSISWVPPAILDVFQDGRQEERQNAFMVPTICYYYFYEQPSTFKILNSISDIKS